ncbi:hypothetical protein CMV_017369 [Castanea mollissima]|uniref:Uncharacterized protein n=1 Tax=Castanea mollissima TaxID=60419 RepID=A0A8J4VDS8_9ROSI|nr:hypothetical protein CMV_017369 [Castanea mollissima]
MIINLSDRQSTESGYLHMLPHVFMKPWTLACCRLLSIGNHSQEKKLRWVLENKTTGGVFLMGLRLESPTSSSSSSSVLKNTSSDTSPSPQYDARLADEAYRAGCAALAAGKLDEALFSLNISLSRCPPDKTNAVAKLQSLIALTSQQLYKSPI